ncbi:hypothetical protein [Iningainema tapete]|uniref:Uncharacterized protein n=1 Tax=Iningainema tapete BLCC-T55 TaxID=2748662 RepID=A0A8J6XGE8_9CYAN|nr:hypothetical protein [Iningainema tapete]MBD2771491.1 hypothetical protein [Iningainema tapete BLCC-T55]
MIADKMRFLHKLLNPRLIAICVLAITLLSTQAALAGYEPTSDQKPPTSRTDSSGVR